MSPVLEQPKKGALAYVACQLREQGAREGLSASERDAFLSVARYLATAAEQ